MLNDTEQHDRWVHIIASALARIETWLRAYRIPLTVFFVSRLGLIFAVYVILLFLPVFPKNGTGLRSDPDNLFIDGWIRWDSLWYRDIAINGYTNSDDVNGYRDARFFPLYPAVIRVVGSVAGNIEIGGLIVSNLGFLAGLLLLYGLTRDYYDEATATRAVVLLSVFPFSYYFSAIYADGLYLPLAIGTFYFGERRQWGLAAACALLGSATRIPGFTLVIGLTILYLEQRKFRWRQIGREAIWLPVSALGIIAVLWLFWSFFGDPFSFITLNSAHFSINELVTMGQAVLQLNPATIASGSFNSVYLLHIVTLVGAIYLTIRSWALPRKAYAVWVIVNLLIALPIWWGGYARFVVTLFPLFITAALILKPKTAFLSVAYLCSLLLGIFAAVFATWHWIS